MCVRGCVCVCVYVCVKERERDNEDGWWGERERGEERERVQCHYKLNFTSQYRPFYTKIKKKKIKKEKTGWEGKIIGDG